MSVHNPKGQQGLAAIRQLQILAEESDPFNEIRKKDKVCNELLASLSKDYPGISGLQEYSNDLLKLRGKSPAVSSLEKLNQKLLASTDPVPDGLKDRLESIIMAFNKGEQAYFKVSSALKIALTSEEEYAYMCGGGKPKKNIVGQVADIMS